ncbi:MAG: hypothetical protein ABFR35_09690 [Thermodesulfobacteriota bacterium]
MMKVIISIIIMLTVMPVSATTGLVLFDPYNWGGPPTIQSILGMSFFGLISVPLWVTYIPSLILTPIIMSKLNRNSSFYDKSRWMFFCLSLGYGSLVGVFILSPAILMALSESFMLALNWTWAGVISGTITFTTIAFLYRMNKPALKPV